MGNILRLLQKNQEIPTAFFLLIAQHAKAVVIESLIKSGLPIMIVSPSPHATANGLPGRNNSANSEIRQVAMLDPLVYDNDLVCPVCTPQTHLGVPRQIIDDTWHAPCYACRKLWKLEKIEDQVSLLQDVA